jgi:hypothetical protein
VRRRQRPTTSTGGDWKIASVYRFLFGRLVVQVVVEEQHHHVCPLELIRDEEGKRDVPRWVEFEDDFADELEALRRDARGVVLEANVKREVALCGGDGLHGVALDELELSVDGQEMKYETAARKRLELEDVLRARGLEALRRPLARDERRTTLRLFQRDVSSGAAQISRGGGM